MSEQPAEAPIEPPDNSLSLQLEAALNAKMEAGEDETWIGFADAKEALEKEKAAFEAAMVEYERESEEQKKRAIKLAEERQLQAEAEALAERGRTIAQQVQLAGRKWVHKPMVTLVDQPIRTKQGRRAKGVIHRAWLHPGDIFTVLSVNIAGAKRYSVGEDVELRTQLEIITAARKTGYIYPEDEDGKSLIELHDSRHFSKRDIMANYGSASRLTDVDATTEDAGDEGDDEGGVAGQDASGNDLNVL